eukprot:scaffold40890_cov62-Attheya_sp.AAC.12
MSRQSAYVGHGQNALYNMKEENMGVHWVFEEEWRGHNKEGVKNIRERRVRREEAGVCRMVKKMGWGSFHDGFYEDCTVL